MRPDHVHLPEDPPAATREAERAAAYERKQRWKELPGNRYTPDELRHMSESLDRISPSESEAHVMHTN